jgi:hypothetical protein
MAAIAFDRAGVPMWDGNGEQHDEYVERAEDLFHGRAGNVELQAATPIHLRAGLSGTAYDAVRRLPHADLVTKSADGKK